MVHSENGKFTCPKCGNIMGKKAYESRHKDSKKCKQYQKFNKDKK